VRIGGDSFKVNKFITGALFGIGITIVSAFLTPELVYPFGPERLYGFFKDPNVLNPTSVYLAFIAISFRKNYGIILAFIVTILAKSRATIISTLVAIVLSNKYLLCVVAIVFVWLYSEILEVAQLLFEFMGRGGVFNEYDGDRKDNWAFMYEEWSKSFFPLGPNWSDHNGYSAHNTYLRILFEQGIVSFLIFVYTLYVSHKSSRKNIFYSSGIIFLMANAFVVDATHWRILFIAIGFSLASKYLSKKNISRDLL
jgi:hypothetical protein